MECLVCGYGFEQGQKILIGCTVVRGAGESDFSYCEDEDSTSGGIHLSCLHKITETATTSESHIQDGVGRSDALEIFDV